ncbi:MAG TPA: hypothetical protein VIY52_04225 [Streptosporangiaceae bacterium]
MPSDRNKLATISLLDMPAAMREKTSCSRPVRACRSWTARRPPGGASGGRLVANWRIRRWVAAGAQPGVERHEAVQGVGGPTAAIRRPEAGHGVVEVADEPGDAAEAAVGVEQVEVIWPGDGAGDEGEDFAAELCQAQGPWRAVEPRRVQVAEQGVHRRSPRARRAAHGRCG